MEVLALIVSLARLARLFDLRDVARNAANVARDAFFAALDAPADNKGPQTLVDDLPAELRERAADVYARLRDGFAAHFAEVTDSKMQMCIDAVTTGLGDPDLDRRLASLRAQFAAGAKPGEVAAKLAQLFADRGDELLGEPVLDPEVLDLLFPRDDSPEEQGEASPPLDLREHLAAFEDDPEALSILCAAMLVDAGIEADAVFDLGIDDGDLALLPYCDADELAEAIDELRDDRRADCVDEMDGLD